MNGDRAHGEDVSDPNASQGRLSGVVPATDQDAVTMIEGDVAVRVSGISDRITRLQQDLERVSARIDQRSPERFRVTEWRHFPEFNFAPQVFQLSLDDQIALLQGTVAERLDREH